ncbi:MAG: SOS response-associated peptidase family protein [Burkholderiaceae bacterium]|nr:SOS response-associated peptidase family protein [Burkholderiaceae bacterium]
MCNRYVSPEGGDMERCWHVGARQPWRTADVFQRSPGPFVRPDRENRQGRVLVIGQWGLVPWFAETPKLTYSTTNARFEEITTKASFKSSWTYGKRCIIPAVSFDELNWESGKNVWWRFRRADGAPWALAGLWNTGTDKTTGEAAESYPMLTLNADLHRLMNRMHKPDRKLRPDGQDKRSAVPIELDDVDTWLGGSLEAAAALVRLPPAEVFDAGPVTP